MSFDDDKKLIVGFGAGILRLWGVLILLLIVAAIFAVAPIIGGMLALLFIGFVSHAIISGNRLAKEEAAALAQEEANLAAIAEGRHCRFIRANGKQCVHGAVVGNFCPRHAKMET